MQNDKETWSCFGPGHDQIHIDPEYVEPIQNIILDMICELLNHPSGRLRAALKKEYADERQLDEGIREAMLLTWEESGKRTGRRRARKTNNVRPKFRPSTDRG